MTANAVIAGSFADFKIVKSRSVAQLIVEIPIERAQSAIEMFGIPLPGQEMPVALARLAEPPKAEDPKPRAIAKSERAREKYRGSDAMEQARTRAVLLCADAAFQQWAGAVTDAQGAERLRHTLDIKSRSEIATDERAFRAFLALEERFLRETGRLTEVR